MSEQAPGTPEHTWHTGLPLAPWRVALMQARIDAAARRKAADEPVRKAIAGEAHGEYGPDGRWVRSRWYRWPS